MEAETTRRVQAGQAGRNLMESAEADIIPSDSLSMLGENDFNSYLKNRTRGRGQGKVTFDTAGLMTFIENLTRGPDAWIGLTDQLEIST